MTRAALCLDHVTVIAVPPRDTRKLFDILEHTGECFFVQAASVRSTDEGGGGACVRVCVGEFVTAVSSCRADIGVVAPPCNETLLL